jgi:hypothetical protein
MSDDGNDQLDLVAQYRDMANDAIQEREAEEWIEGLISDVSAEE